MKKTITVCNEPEVFALLVFCFEHLSSEWVLTFELWNVLDFIDKHDFQKKDADHQKMSPLKT